MLSHALTIDYIFIGRRYYSGKIINIHPGAVYDISYDDGDKDIKLSQEFIRRLPDEDVNKSSVKDSKRQPRRVSTPEPRGVGNAEDESEIFVKGQRVEARYHGRGRKYYKGVINDVLPDGFYNIDYDDGDRDRNLPASAIQALATIDKPEEESDAAMSLSSKSSRKSRHRLPTKALKSVDKSIDKDEQHKNTSDLSYETVDIVEAPVSENLNRHFPEHKDGCVKPPSELISVKSTKNDVDDLAEPTFTKGDRVEAKFRGHINSKRWYKGIITECLPNGMYAIQYDDGDNDPQLPAEAIRTIARPEGPNGPDPRTAAKSPSKKSTLSSPKQFAQISSADGDVSFVAIEEDNVRRARSKHLRAAERRPMDDTVKEELSLVEDDVSSEASAPKEETVHHSNVTIHTGKGNRLYRGIVSKVRVVHLYEIEYPDGTRDVNIPLSALRMDEGVTSNDVDVGTQVDVLSWQDRLWSSHD